MRWAATYHRPSDLTRALELLDALGGQALLLAGGTDLMVEMREGKHGGSHLVDISRLPELKLLELKDGEIHLGAGLTFTEILGSELLRLHAPALVQAASQIGSLQIRNVATLGGNVVHCSPCADSVPGLLVQDARAILQSRGGTRDVPVQEILVGPYKSGIQPGELLTRFSLRSASGMWGAFHKLARRSALAIARLSLAVLARQGDEGLSDVRIALGSGTPVPRRMVEVEEFLLGKAPTEEDLWEAGRVLASKMVEVAGMRASTVYKERAAQGLLVQAMMPLVRHGN